MKVLYSKILLLVGSLAAVTVLTDVLLSKMIGQSRADLFVYTTDSERYKVMRREAACQIYGVPFLTNDQGFRDSDGSIAVKKEGEYRIIVIGDSFSVCAGVPYDRLYSQILESKLREVSPEQALSVINLACAGYNIIQYDHVLTEAGLDLDPDLIVLALYPPNDFDGEGYREHRAVAFAEQDPTIPSWLEQRYLHQIVVPRGRVLLRRLFRQTRPERTPSDVAFARSERLRNEQALTQILSRCRERQLELLTVLLPGNSDYSAQVPTHLTLRERCAEDGGTVIDALDSFLEDGRAPVQFRVNIVDSHPNAAYNALVAEALLPAVREAMRRHSNSAGHSK